MLALLLLWPLAAVASRPRPTLLLSRPKLLPTHRPTSLPTLPTWLTKLLWTLLLPLTLLKTQPLTQLTRLKKPSLSKHAPTRIGEGRPIGRPFFF